MGQDNHSYGKATGNSLGGPESWGDRASGNHQGGANSVSQIDGVSDMVPAASSVACGAGGGLRKATVASASPSVLEKAAPSSLALTLDNSVPPHTFLIPFNLPPLQWSSEGVSLSKSVQGPFKRNCLGLQKFLSSTASIPTGYLQPEVMDTYLSGTRTLSW